MHAATGPDPGSSTINPVRTPPSRAERIGLIVLVVGALAWSGFAPKDRLTWLLEVMWVIAGVADPRAELAPFPADPVLCWLLAAHALVLIHGGAYTYAETPLGFWLRDSFTAWVSAIHGIASAISCRVSSRRSLPANCCCG